MTRTIGTSGKNTHALIDGSSLCGATVTRTLATSTPFAITQWAAMTSFSGACSQCVAELKTDPTVAKYAKNG